MTADQAQEQYNLEPISFAYCPTCMIRTDGEHDRKARVYVCGTCGQVSVNGKPA